MTTINEKTCNCRAKSGCPLDGNVSAVYKAEITPTHTQESKVYIGITAGPFKERYNNHKKSLTNAKCAKETELSKYAWNLKENGRSFCIKWSIIKLVPAYTSGGRSCDLCLEEKILILKSNKDKTLNKRSELFAKCCHRNKFNAQNFKRARACANT